MRARPPCASSPRSSAIAVDAGALEQIDQMLCDLGNETELTTVFRLEHDGPFTLRLPELAGLAVLPRGERPDPMSPSAVLLERPARRRAPGWDRLEQARPAGCG